ncbi:pentapeptide repeat-containing protein [Candidatus Babeliales bacterium]|nr:pentapeptide repeat-containing protein [Candidatus Babeliales bacterium]
MIFDLSAYVPEHLAKAQSLNEKLKDLDLDEIDEQVKNGIITQEDLDLSNFDLSAADLKDFNLSCANLQNTDLNWARLDNAVLYNVNFKNASLIAANFEDANLWGADFEGANMTIEQIKWALKCSYVKNLDIKRYLATNSKRRRYWCNIL